MAYQQGTAANERDLLDKINTFLTTDAGLVADGQSWEVLLDRTIAATSGNVDVRQIAWRSSGTSVEQDMYICASTYNNITSDIYNLKFAGGTYFNAELVTKSDIFAGLTKPSPAVTLFFDARECDYGIVASGRRAVIYSRISNTNICSSAYLGFVLPTVTPLEYGYPLCVAGSSGSDVRYSIDSNSNSSIVHALNKNVWLFTPDQTWRTFGGKGNSNGSGDNGNQFMMPLNVSDNLTNQQKVINGDPIPLYPVEFLSGESSTQGGNRWGAYDGVYWIPGVQRAIFDTVTYNGHRGIIVNNGYRTTVLDYFVIEVE